MKRLPIIAATCLLLSASCNNDHSRAPEAPNMTATESADSSAGFTLAAPPAAEADKAVSLTDPSRKIIKTADLRCRVGDVYAAATRLERLAATTGGQISQSSMENVTDDTRRLPYKVDSLKQVESFTTTAHLTLRIPVMQLDTVLSDIAASASFINSRNLHLDDVTLRYLSNKLKNDAMAQNDAAGRVSALARHSGEAVISGDYTDERNETLIDRRIENMQLTDQVTYATLTVDLYQPQRIAQTIVPDIEYLMKPTMGQQAGLALSNGWQALRATLIGLLQVWPLLLMVSLGLLWYRRSRGRYPAREAVVRA